MKDFKNSTRVQYSKGGDVGPKGAAKVAKVMREFKRGELHSGSKEGPKVTSRKQATAIAMSEARQPLQKKSLGGLMNEAVSSRPVDAGGRRVTLADLERANRDTGGMTAAEVHKAGEAIKRANRTPAERIPGKTNEARTMNRPPVRKTGVGAYNSQPLVGKSGLSVMPRTKP